MRSNPIYTINRLDVLATRISVFFTFHSWFCISDIILWNHSLLTALDNPQIFSLLNPFTLIGLLQINLDRIGGQHSWVDILYFSYTREGKIDLFH